MDPFFSTQVPLLRALYANVQNTAEVRKLVLTAGLPFAMVKPRMIVDDFQVSVAVTRALYSQKEGCMRTKGFATEVIYSLSPSRNIRDSLTTFGSEDDDAEILFIGEEPSFPLLRDAIKGSPLPLSHLASFTDAGAVAAAYQIKAEELARSSLLDAVVSRMAAKEYLAGD